MFLFIYHVFYRDAPLVSRKVFADLENDFYYIDPGTGCVGTSIYLMDISPRTMRGEIIAFHQLFIVIGILIGQIVGIPWLLGQQK